MPSHPACGAARHCLLLLSLLFFSGVPVQAQRPPLLSLQTSDSLHRGRIWLAASAGTVAYAATMTGLYKAWYADYPASKFHYFNDLREWNQMDKMGHWLMSYNESRWVFNGARWTGIQPRPAAWLGFAGGQLIQTSFEIFDGFSRQWGFSWGDIAFNTLGSGLFLAQQLGWGEQRILMKMSAWPVDYPETAVFDQNSQNPTTLEARADALYGHTAASLFLKNYNTLVVWASVNPCAFAPGGQLDWWPKWLNLAAGMGSDNLFAGFGYAWQADKDCTGDDCIRYRLDPDQYPRTRQLLLSADIDLTRLPVKNRLLRSVLSAINIFKIPAPALEWTDRGKLLFHPLYF